MESELKKRRTAACIASIVALIALMIFTRCNSDDGSQVKAEAASLDTDTEFQTDSDTHVTGDKKESLTGTENILLLGVDRSGNQTGRTDSMMIVSVNHNSGHVGVISVPRDIWVDIPGCDPGRINSVARVGERTFGKGKGFFLLKRVIKNELGISVDHTVILDYKGFETIVDLIGGIEIDVRCPIKDNFISPGAPGGREPLDLGAGPQKINGRTALLFARSRHGRGDHDRSRRQQALLVGLKKTISKLENIPKLPLLITVARRHMATDLEMDHVLTLAKVAASMNSQKLHGLVLNTPVVTGFNTPDGKSVLHLNKTLFKESLDSLFEAPMPGTRQRPRCPLTDAALNWKDNLRKRQQAKQELENDTTSELGIENPYED